MKTFQRIFKRLPFLQQTVPLFLTLVVFLVLSIVLHLVVSILNRVTQQPIILRIRPIDVGVGVTIYLKTAIDFAIFIGRLMAVNPDWRSRIAIEIGTALGNALGTLAVIVLWVFLKDIDILLALMVFLASLVLFELAHGSLEYFSNWEGQGKIKRSIYATLHHLLDAVNRVTHPLLSRITPDLSVKLRGTTALSWRHLLIFSFSIPFILGLDDFAGYVPLFSIVNVYGFSIGVFAAHTLLNIALFLSPQKTVDAVKNEYISFAGVVAFIAIAIYGFYETWRIVAHLIPLP